MVLDVLAVLEHNGVLYTISDTVETIFGSFDKDERHIFYMWTEGNYGCDCNRSEFIREQSAPSFPELPCGETITLLELSITAW